MGKNTEGCVATFFGCEKQMSTSTEVIHGNQFL